MAATTAAGVTLKCMNHAHKTKEEKPNNFKVFLARRDEIYARLRIRSQEIMYLQQRNKTRQKIIQTPKYLKELRSMWRTFGNFQKLNGEFL